MEAPNKIGEIAVEIFNILDNSDLTSIEKDIVINLVKAEMMADVMTEIHNVR